MTNPSNLEYCMNGVSEDAIINANITECFRGYAYLVKELHLITSYPILGPLPCNNLNGHRIYTINLTQKQQ